MNDNQAMNREEYLRRYIANFIKAYGVNHFQSWVIVDGVSYDFNIKRIGRIDNGDNGFIQ